MLKLLVKQGPFYISSFTALFLAMHQTGWLDRLFPILEDQDMGVIAEPMIGDALSCEKDPKTGETFCVSEFALSEFPDLEFISDPVPFYQEPWFVLAAFVVGGLFIGWIASRAWRWIFG